MEREYLGPSGVRAICRGCILEVSVGLAVEEPEGGARGAKEQRTAQGGSVSVALSLPPHACSPCFKCLAAWDRGDCFPFSPPPATPNIWDYIRHSDLVKKIVMEICNREPLSKERRL